MVRRISANEFVPMKHAAVAYCGGLMIVAERPQLTPQTAPGTRFNAHNKVRMGKGGQWRRLRIR
jgi:hypothetical protein